MSLAASVLTAALALPQPGLVVAYDFARTNFVNWSEDFTATAWAKSNCTVATATAQLADGTSGTVARVVDTTANAQHILSVTSFLPADNAPQSFVWRLKAAEYRYVGVQWANKALTAYPTTIVDLQDGVILNAGTGASMGTTITATSGGLAYTVTVAAAGNGWWDVTVTVPSVGAGTNSPRPALLLHNSATAANNYTFAGTGTSGVLIHRMQWNATPGPLPYERTTDGQTLVDRSVRLWPVAAGRVNLVNWSEDFWASAWSKSAATISGNTLSDDTTNAPHGLNTTLPSNIPNGVPVIGYCDVQAGTLRYLLVRLRDRAGDSIVGGRATFDLQTGTVVTVSGGQASITPLGGGVYRCAVWGSSGSGAVVPEFGLFMVDTLAKAQASNANYAGTGNGTVLVHRTQVAFGSAVTPYERQADGTTPDHSLRGANLLTSADLGSAPWSRSGVGIPTLDTATGLYRFTLSGGNIGHHVSIGIPAVYSGVPIFLSLDVVPETCRRVYLNTGYKDGSTTFAGGWDFDANTALGSSNAGTVGLTTRVLDVGGGVKRVIVRVPTTGFGLGQTSFYVYFGQYGNVSADGQTMLVGRPMVGYADIPYERPAGHSTLGSSSGADANDPAWVPQGLSFDGVDDSTIAGAFSLPDGDLTFIHVFTPLVDSGTTDGKALTRTNNVAGQWRMTSYFGGLTAGGVTGMGWKVGLYHATGGFSNTGFTYFNVGLVAANQARVGVIRVRGLTARAELLASATMPAAGQSQVLPAAPVGGLFNGFGSTANAIQHGFYVWSRALSDAELAQAYRFIRTQLSRRGVSI